MNSDCLISLGGKLHDPVSYKSGIQFLTKRPPYAVWYWWVLNLKKQN